MNLFFVLCIVVHLILLYDIYLKIKKTILIFVDELLKTPAIGLNFSLQKGIAIKKS